MIRFISSLTILMMIVSCAQMTTSPQKSPKQKRGELYYSHGTAKLMNKEYTEALELLMKAAQDIPEDSKVHNNLAMAYYFKNRKNLAIEHLQEALDLNEKNSDARNNLASILFEKGELDQAKKQYEIIREDLIYPHQHRVKYNLALIHLRKGERRQAVELLSMALKDKADYCPAGFQLGKLYEQSYKYQKALDWYVKASDGDCNGEPAPHFRQAEVLAAMNLYEKAVAKYQTVLEVFPESHYSGLAAKRLKEIERTQRVSVKESPLMPSKKISSPSF